MRLIFMEDGLRDLERDVRTEKGSISPSSLSVARDEKGIYNGIRKDLWLHGCF